jgi:two-component system chemotaxis response regulator CheB
MRDDVLPDGLGSVSQEVRVRKMTGLTGMRDRLSRPIVVVGASAGGVEALQNLVLQLPEDFAASLFLVLHLTPTSPSHLAEILQRVSRLPVRRAMDKDPIKPGHIYVAQPNHHLLVEKGQVRISLGPKENRFRPAVDVLFRSAALAYGEQVTGVILTGALDDGTAGLLAIKKRGGMAVVQDPRDAFMPSMPQNALRHVAADHVVPLSEMGAVLARAVCEPVKKEKEAPISMTAEESEEWKRLEAEVAVSLGDDNRMREIMAMGAFTPFTCPECHGVLVKIKQGKMAHFRCHTGHGFTLNHLLSEVTQYNEEVLMSALRALEETELLLEYTREHLEENDSHEASAVVQQKVEHVKRQAAAVKQAALENEVLSLDNLRILNTREIG